MYRIESELKEVPLEELRPTQITVGFKEVDAKRKSWSKLSAKDRKKAMDEEFFPAVRGPDDLDPESDAWDRHYAHLPLDPYGAHDEAEFFAVSSEAFFVEPGRLRDAFPEWYELLTQFFLQDPLAA